MLSLTPDAIRLVEFYEDGDDVGHFTFEPVDATKGFPDVCNPEKVEPGQFFMLSIPGKGEAAFTYTHTPDENGRFVALIRNIGCLTRQLFKTEVGSILGGRGPMGKGWPDFKGQNVLVVAGGLGLAPVAAEIYSLIEKESAPTVYFAARNESMLVLRNERDDWMDKCDLYQAVDDLDSLTGKSTVKTNGGQFMHGRKLADNLAQILEEKGPFDHVITCGPEGMMEAVCKIMMGLGQSADSLWLSLERRMHCGVGLCGHCYVAEDLVCVDGPTYRWDQLGELVVKEKAIKPPAETVDMTTHTRRTRQSA
ncbi:iron-sulfur cluster-binding protein [Sansalvadorimonas verongulae]|uniref:iron-sulfur cluster-binding protein n=1 Tax=Sansalvadorimonas verongulae TaxID=2172824 RepID=UPI0012BC74FE|nr:oxidoreductase [Sansalvadorimonas verongulae]MTI14592.1 oxidoreductase [Sansalvadorimonas verongulae]